MKKFFNKVGNAFRSFMQGRYGTDELSYFLFTMGFMLFLLPCLIQSLAALYLPALVLLVWSSFRSLSKNIYNRKNERDTYLRISRNIKQKLKFIKNRWHERKTHRYYKCPHCKVIVRIPKPGKGRNISITCPQCHTRFEKKT